MQLPAGGRNLLPELTSHLGRLISVIRTASLNLILIQGCYDFRHNRDKTTTDRKINNSQSQSTGHCYRK